MTFYEILLIFASHLKKKYESFGHEMLKITIMKCSKIIFTVDLYLR